ncbi:ribosomal protein S18-alanine N-acetyltransferase [Actinopolymorpha alba]|uniref:ribosomal protein S18-alanine N-acetyltransferase n=1 Tax=Actinopolymorpha alba TaxID=533267 RepID=UPI000360089D|nr:ribosomal protein S18-alanine N-acetyltransferase [Actinopolymorpha alba]
MVSLRPAQPADLTALRELETACFGREAWGEQALRGEFDGVPETRYVLVAEDAGAVVGYASLLAIDTTADVQRIAVRPDCQRHGIGRGLLDVLVCEARDRGCVEALLEVRDDNAGAIAMYETFGFVVIARRRGYYGGQADALVLRLALGSTPG